MTVKKEQVAAELARRGYRVVHETTKKQGWQRDQRPAVYLNLKSGSGASVLIVHPEVPAQRMADAAPGTSCGADWFHSSNLKLFPKRQHRGLDFTGYGWPLSFESEVALQSFLAQVEAVA